MPRLARICAIAVLFLASAEAVSAIEKFTWVKRADAVVVGQIKLSSYFMWFDGLHVNGTIVATEILYGDGHAGQEFAFHFIFPCTVWDAVSSRWRYLLLRQHWSYVKELVTQKRIWALYRRPGASWTIDDITSLIYRLTDREEVIAILGERKQREQDRKKP